MKKRPKTRTEAGDNNEIHRRILGQVPKTEKKKNTHTHTEVTGIV